MAGEPDPNWPRDAALAVGHEVATIPSPSRSTRCRCLLLNALVTCIARWRVFVAVVIAWGLWAALAAWLSFRHADVIRSILEG